MNRPDLAPVVPSAKQMEDIAAVRRAFYELFDALERILPNGRYASLTATAAEEASMWAVKSISHEGGDRG